MAAIQGHGGPLVLQRILRLVLAQGARMANPGEFTMRAFLNGRLDLAQAEAVMDLISSQTEIGQRLAMQQLQGRISEQVQHARHTLLGVIARIEASIDFPEEDVPTPRTAELLSLIHTARQQVNTLLAGSDQGRLYRQGLRTAIIGRPNVGKSSLLNALLRSERAIVTPVAGTTRDTVEEIANLRGIPLHLIDTAGITPTSDPVEQIGVERSRAAAASADLILLVFDGASPLTEQDTLVSQELWAMGFGANTHASSHSKGGEGEDERWLSRSPSRVGDRPVIVVINKVDRPQQIEIGQLHELEEAIITLVLAGKTTQSEGPLVTSARHQESLRRAAEHISASLLTLQQGVPLDFVSIDLRAAYDALGEVTGETASEDLLERIFSEFCIGK